MAGESWWAPTFLWDNAQAPNLVHDEALGAARAYPLEPAGVAVLDRHFALACDGGGFTASPEAAANVAGAARRTNAITIEALLAPTTLAEGTLEAPLPIFASSGPTPNFLLGQAGDWLVLRLRVGKDPGAAIPIATLAGTGHAHVAVTYTPGSLVAYLDGQRVFTSTDLQGDFFFWKPRTLTACSASESPPPFRGLVSGLGVWSRVLDADTIAEDSRRVRQALDAEPRPARLVLDLKLVALSTPPTIDRSHPT